MSRTPPRNFAELLRVIEQLRSGSPIDLDRVIAPHGNLSEAAQLLTVVLSDAGLLTAVADMVDGGRELVQAYGAFAHRDYSDA